MEVLTRAQDRLRSVQEETSRGLSLRVLERGIHELVRRLEPSGLTQLRRVLTTPQAAIAFQAQHAAKEILLGHDGRER